ncbi:MAG TPA: hypothetical protein VK742_01845 [Candidatus Sulfotelmatobacter sp.]|jgi:hypothetical protein|nr:hypothetical protein [Candidatus Sulfotelmatobacter sp.]
MMDQTNTTAVATTPEMFRPLEWDELARRGDYVKDGNNGFELWVGPSGFHAGSFNKQIYRRKSPPPVVEKPAE